MADIEDIHQRIYKAVHGRMEPFLNDENIANAIWLGTEDAAKGIAASNAQPIDIARLIEKLEREILPKPNDHAQEGANYAIGRIVRALRELEKENG